MFNWKSLKGLGLKIYAYASTFLESKESSRYTAIFVLALALLLLGALCVYNAFFRQEGFLLAYRWLGHAIPAVLLVFIATFALPGCFEGLFTNIYIDGIYYFHPNHVGSVKMVTDEDGNLVDKYFYDPYGSLLTAHSSETGKSKYMYTAQELDGTTGLYYYNARFYDPAISRFISADSVVPDPGSTQSFNRYMYVRGNPVMSIDPTGQYDYYWAYYYYGYNQYDNGSWGQNYYNSNGYTGNISCSPSETNSSDPAKTTATTPAVTNPGADTKQIPGVENNEDSGSKSKAGSDIEEIAGGDNKKDVDPIEKRIEDLLKRYAQVRLEYKREISIFGIKFTIKNGVILYGKGEGIIALCLSDGSEETVRGQSIGPVRVERSVSTTGSGKDTIGVNDGTLLKYFGLSTDGYVAGIKGTIGKNTYSNCSISVSPTALATSAALITVYSISPSLGNSLNQTIRQIQYAY